MSITAIAAVTIGVHLGSTHTPQKDQNNVNPGIYLRQDHWQAGYYRNSYRRSTFYAGYVQPIGPFEVMLGAATGYKKSCQTYLAKVGEQIEIEHREDGSTVKTKSSIFEDREACQGFAKHSITPLAAITYAIPFEIAGVKPRIWIGPGKATTVFHLSLERDF